MAIMDLQASRENTDALMSMWRERERERGGGGRERGRETKRDYSHNFQISI